MQCSGMQGVYAQLTGEDLCLFYIYIYLPLVAIYLYVHCYFLIFFYKLTVLNGLSLTTLSSEEVHSALWQFQMGGSSAFGIYMFIYLCWYFLIFSYKLTVSNGFTLLV